MKNKWFKRHLGWNKVYTFFLINVKKIILVSLKPILDSKLSKGEGETLITHDECQ